MKNSALQIANQIVNDSKKYIDGNIADHMIQQVGASENSFYLFLTDEEIEEVNGNHEKWNELREQVYSMLRENFDIDIDDLFYS